LRAAGRRYRSGEGFAVAVEVLGIANAGVDIEVIMVDVGLAARVAIRAVEIKAESSLVTPGCAIAERSVDEDEEVVDVEGVAGYRERLPAASFSAC